MKHILLVLFTLFFIKGYSQNDKSFSDKVRNKTLKTQIKNHEAISKEIIQIFDADKTARKYANAMTDKNAMEFRKLYDMKDDQNLVIEQYVLSIEDSVKLKLYDQNELLYQKFLEYSLNFNYIEKLSKEDEKIQKQFYREKLNYIDSRYTEYFEKIRKNETKYQKIRSQTYNFKYPQLIKCEGDLDLKKCFSTIFKTEIENNYVVEDYIIDNYEGIIKTNILLRITKDGTYEPLEIAFSSHKFFLDMTALDIADDLFKDKKIAMPNDKDFYIEIPLIFNFED